MAPPPEIAPRSPGGKKTSQRHKTFYELEAEEAEEKKQEDEAQAEERARLEKSKRFWWWTAYVPTPSKVKKVMFPPDWLKLTIKKLQTDPKGQRIAECFKILHVTTRAEKMAWVKLWCEMDKTFSNRLEFRKFMTYFNLTDDTWSRRIFDVMNDCQLNGLTQFEEFLMFCAKYCYIDKHSTIEFSFRIISRRGSVFKPKISVLDLEDLRQFVRFKYKMSEPNAIQKRALAIFDYVDTEGSGSIDIEIFESFAKKNPALVRFTHIFQQHMRKCIFGLNYWVEKSRVMKTDHATGLDNLALTSRMNMEAESFASIALHDPVVDDRGRAIITPAYVPPNIFIGAKPPQTASTGGGQDKSITTTPQLPLPLVPQQQQPPAKLPSLKPSMLAWHGPLSNAVKSALLAKYAEEFAEVYLMKLEKKLAKRAKKAKDSQLANAVASHTYKRLVGICEDIIYGRKWIRLAFNAWMDNVGLERRATPSAVEAAEEARLVARKRMANLITKENVNLASSALLSPDALTNKMAEEEKKAKDNAAAMFGPKDELSAIAAKLEADGNMTDDMHARIVENCHKQELMIDDADDQCATYLRERFLHDQIAAIQSYRHERLSNFVEQNHRGNLSLHSSSSGGVIESYQSRLTFALESDRESDEESI